MKYNHTSRQKKKYKVGDCVPNERTATEELWPLSSAAGKTGVNLRRNFGLEKEYFLGM